MSIEERLDWLERENRRLKVGAIIGLLVVGATFIMGQTRPPANLPAEKFSLIRPGGGVLGSFETSHEKPWLILYDSGTEETNDRANPAVNGYDTASVWVRGHGNDGAASIDATRGGQPSVSLRDTNGRTRLFMTLSSSTQDPRIEMMDQDGSVIWSAP